MGEERPRIRAIQKNNHKSLLGIREIDKTLNAETNVVVGCHIEELGEFGKLSRGLLMKELDSLDIEASKHNLRFFFFYIMRAKHCFM